MDISKTLGSGLAAALAVFSLSTGAFAQALPIFLGPGQTYIVTTPTVNDFSSFQGTIDIQAPNGALTTTGSSSNGGTLINGGALITGSSAYLSNYGTITNNGTTTNGGTLQNFDGGVLTSSGTLTNNGSLENFAGGVLTSSGTLTNNSILQNFDGGVLTSGGTLTNNSGLYNSSGGTLVNEGTLTNNSYISNDGAFENSGDVNITGYGYMYGTGSFTQTAGSTTVDGQLYQAAITIAGGTLGGSGIVLGNITVDGGTVGPGNSPGLLYVFGDIEFLAGSTFAAELGGLAYGTGYDRLDVNNGTATLAAGTMFDIDFFGAFTAGLGDTFDVLVGDDIQAALMSSMLFDFTGAALASGLAWDYGIVDFGDGRDALRLSVVEVPEPGAALLFGLGLVGLGCARRSRRAR